jgi:bifunctional DNA-binding transcriptional regulator/antitoxin component of YhaV-PrlF toxin-antitoxin module
MSTSTLTSKGQTTIPKDIRKRLKVQALRRKTVLSTTLIERLCSLARHRERTAHAHAGAR